MVKMMNNKIFLGLLIILFLVTGCGTTTNQGDIKAFSIDEKKYDTSNFNYITCTRDTETEDDSEVEIKYELYYDDENYLEVLKSYEKVTSSNSDILKQYQDAYKNIYSVYDGLDYYDHEIKEGSNSITSITYINYGKINMDRLMDIEGTEDNVKVTDGKVKLDDWISFAKKYGTQCESVA